MKSRPRASIATLFVGALVIVSLIIGVMQYRWIGEVSRAERERLRATLHTSLIRLGQDFNTEVNAAAAALLPEPDPDGDPEQAELLADYAARYRHWRETSQYAPLFRTIGVAVRAGGGVKLFRFQDGEFRPSDWPADWVGVRTELEARAEGGDPRRMMMGPPEESELVFSVPYLQFDRGREGRERRGFREREWLILQVDVDYLRSAMMPELIRRYLGDDYDAELAVAERTAETLMKTGAGVGGRADDKVKLFDPRPDHILRRAGIFRGRGGRGPDEGPSFDRGRWLLSVRHRGGSLEAVVQRGRLRNIAGTTALMLGLCAAVLALLQYTRRAQRLADLQMEFVASVSHELRTPLTVMRTAGHNLRGERVSADPARVQRYGALIEEQSGKLTDIVDQILSFSNTNAGRVIGAREPLEVAGIIDEALEGSRGTVEKSIAEDLPLVSGDATTLRHAIRNLVDNAVKYGREHVRVSAAGDGNQVVIRVEDDGPGIPADELPHLFDPFYRGKKAIEDQIHGTGLGLCLTKRIVEAHDGSIRVQSAPGKGSHFIVRLPAVRTETV